MKIKYPNTAISEASRLSVCFRLEELLRIEHNEMGAKFKAGLITAIAWEDYKKEFEKKSRAIHASININRELASKGTFWGTLALNTSVMKEAGEL